MPSLFAESYSERASEFYAIRLTSEVEVMKKR